MLWLYDSGGTNVAYNDDYYGLQSYISFTVQPGAYTLVAGFCCGDPNATRPGQRYTLETNTAAASTTLVPQTTTTQETTTTVQQTTLPTELETTTTNTTTTTTFLDVVPTTDHPTTSSAETRPSVATSSSQVDTTTSNVETVAPTTTIQRVDLTTSVPEPPASDLPTTSLPQTTLPPTTTTVSVPPTPPNSPLGTVRVLATTPPQTAAGSTTSSVAPVDSSPEVLQATTTTVAPDVLAIPAAPTGEQLAAVIGAADTQAEREALTTQLNTAPDSTKRTFENTINVYSGQWDNYVPAGSRIPVGERRTLIAVMGAVVSLASTAPRRKN
jgi:hypothetical protein